MSDLYYLAPEDRAQSTPEKAVLSGAEAQHLARVMRGRPGDEVTLFDGAGSGYRARIATVSRNKVELDVLETLSDDREPEIAVTAVVALPKGDRQKWMVEKLTELGARRFIPLTCERSDVKVDAGVRERLERQTLEASKQCGRLTLMSVTPGVAFDELPALAELLDARTSSSPQELSPDAARLQSHLGESLFDEFHPGDGALRVITHPRSDGDFGQRGFKELVHARKGAIPRGVVILVGPPGGFAHEEVRRAVDAGWTPLDLGRQVYRVETAALVASALFIHIV